MIYDDKFYLASCDSCDKDFDMRSDGGFTVYRKKDDLVDDLDSACWLTYKDICVCDECVEKEEPDGAVDMKKLYDEIKNSDISETD